MRPKPLQPLLKEKKLSWLRSILALACLLLTASPLFAQTKTVTGTVTDAQNEPLIGVSVLIQGTASGTVTDLDGNYSISVMPENVLEFSYVGMQKQDIRVGLQTVINVVMKDDSQMLAETVVIGYGSAKKRDLTGSITNIKGEEIANKPATNPLSSLQGKIAGVQIINNGRAGDDPEIRIHQRLQTFIYRRRTLQRQYQLPQSGRHRIDGSPERPVITGHLRSTWCKRCDHHHHQKGQRGTDKGKYQYLFRLEISDGQDCHDQCRTI